MKYSMKSMASCAAILAAMLVTPAFAQTSKADEEKDDSGVWRVSTGVNYSSGDYGEIDKTKVISTPVAIKYSNDNFSVRVSVPYVWIDGPGSLLDTPDGGDGGGGGGRGRGRGRGGSGSGDVDVDDSGGVAPPSSKRNGIGDVVVAATYSFDLGSDFFLDATGRVKLPTASKSKRLGTGKVDFTAAADFGKDIGPASLYVHGRRRFAGNSAVTPVRDTWGAGAGASIKASDGVTLGADYDWQQSAIVGRGASQEVTAWASFRVADGLSLSAFGSTGLNSNSTDFAAGLTLSVRLN